MEHARLVLNTIAQFERLLEPVFDSRSPDERKELSRAMIKWLAAAPNSLLRAALLDQPCPAEFFEPWIPYEQLKAWVVESQVRCSRSLPIHTGIACIRPSEFSRALRRRETR